MLLTVTMRKLTYSTVDEHYTKSIFSFQLSGQHLLKPKKVGLFVLFLFQLIFLYLICIPPGPSALLFIYLTILCIFCNTLQVFCGIKQSIRKGRTCYLFLQICSPSCILYPGFSSPLLFCFIIRASLLVFPTLLSPAIQESCLEPHAMEP